MNGHAREEVDGVRRWCGGRSRALYIRQPVAKSYPTRYRWVNIGEVCLYCGHADVDTKKLQSPPETA